MVLNKTETWDRLVSNGSPSYQLSITELGSRAMDIYENENIENHNAAVFFSSSTNGVLYFKKE